MARSRRGRGAPSNTSAATQAPSPQVQNPARGRGVGAVPGSGCGARSPEGIALRNAPGCSQPLLHDGAPRRERGLIPFGRPRGGLCYTPAMSALAPPRDRLPRRREAPEVGPWLLLFAAGFAMRAVVLWLVLGMPAHPAPDSAVYDTVAWNLARRAGFSLDGAAGPYPTAFVPPMLPWLTNLLYRAVGHQYAAALLLQCGIGALVPLLLAALAGATFGLTTGRLAAWLAVFDPLLVLFSGSLHTETLFAAVLLGALLASAEWVKTPRRGRAVGAGLLWGLATLTRPSTFALPLVILAWAWTPLGLTSAPRERLRQVSLLLLGALLAVGPWTVRNAVVLHAFIPVTTGGGMALLDGNNPSAWTDPVLRGDAVRSDRLEPWASRLRGRGEPAADALARREAVAFAAAHLREWPAVAWAKLARFWQLGARGGDFGSLPPGGTLRAGAPDLLLVWSALLFPCALWGLVRTLRGARRWFQSLPLLAILYFSALAIVFWGEPRMRLPVEPSIALFAAVGLEDLRHRLRARARGFKVVTGRR
jgi:hypothetical protein